MKPFDLQAALAGAKVVTRDGREVKIAGYNPDADYHCQLVGGVGKSTITWYSNGMFSKHEKDSEFDLFMAPTEKKEWIVRATNNGSTFISQAFLNYQDAKIHADNIYYYVPTIHEITVIE